MKELRQFTIARVGLGRAGNSLPTSELLAFQLAHARARDAVHQPLSLEEIGLTAPFVAARSAAANRATYLRRPDLGRSLHPDSRAELEALPKGDDAVFVIADGLSALAIHRHAKAVLSLVMARLERWKLAPVVVVEQGRVAIGDEIGQILEAKLAVVLIGERPGLSSPDSLGIYLTWEPRRGRTDAERNCLSNIHSDGTSYEAAAARLLALMEESRRRQLSGVELKEGSSLLAPHCL